MPDDAESREDKFDLELIQKWLSKTSQSDNVVLNREEFNDVVFSLMDIIKALARLDAIILQKVPNVVDMDDRKQFKDGYNSAWTYLVRAVNSIAKRSVQGETI